MDREKSESHNDIYCMACALKGTVLKIVKEKVISTCCRCGHYGTAVSRALHHEVVLLLKCKHAISDRSST